MKRAALIALLCLALGGCVDRHAQFQDANGHWVGGCSATGWGIIGAIVAASNYNTCMERAQEKGLRPI